MNVAEVRHLVPQSRYLGQRFLPSLFDSLSRRFILRKRGNTSSISDSTSLPRLVTGQVVEALNMRQAIVSDVIAPHNGINRLPHGILRLELLAVFQKKAVQLFHSIGLAFLFGPQQERPIQFCIDHLPRLLHCLQSFTDCLHANASEDGCEDMPQHSLGILKQRSGSLVGSAPEEQFGLDRHVEQETHDQIAELIEARQKVGDDKTVQTESAQAVIDFLD